METTDKEVQTLEQLYALRKQAVRLHRKGMPVTRSSGAEQELSVGADELHRAAGAIVRLCPRPGGTHAEQLYAGIRESAVLMSDGYEVYNGIAH